MDREDILESLDLIQVEITKFQVNAPATDKIKELKNKILDEAINIFNFLSNNGKLDNYGKEYLKNAARSFQYNHSNNENVVWLSLCLASLEDALTEGPKRSTKNFKKDHIKELKSLNDEDILNCIKDLQREINKK